MEPQSQAIYDDLAEAGAFGPDASSRWNWLTFVRRRPDVAAELLGELRYARTRVTIRNPGAWMMDRWVRMGRPDR